MTRKDYEKIAAVIRAADRPHASPGIYRAGITETRNYIGNSLADMLAADNPRFDRARFLKACGLEE